MVSIATLSALDAPPETPAGPVLTAEDEAFLSEILRPLTADEEELESERLLGLRYDTEGSHGAP